MCSHLVRWGEFTFRFSLIDPITSQCKTAYTRSAKNKISFPCSVVFISIRDNVTALVTYLVSKWILDWEPFHVTRPYFLFSLSGISKRASRRISPVNTGISYSNSNQKMDIRSDIWISTGTSKTFCNFIIILFDGSDYRVVLNSLSLTFVRFNVLKTDLHLNCKQNASPFPIESKDCKNVKPNQLTH
jgi:hypothetical protein